MPIATSPVSVLEDKVMPAPVCNEFWKARSSHGRNRIYEGSAQLWEDCEEYFEWVEANPLPEDKLFCSQGEIVRSTVYHMRAMTQVGLCIFLGISRQTWENYRVKEDFMDITERVESVIRDQKFTGAAAGLLNPNIIARDLGLRERQQIEHNGLTDCVNMSDDDLERRIHVLQQALEAGRN